MQVSYSYCNIRHPDIHQDIFHWHGYKVHCFCNDYYNVLCNPVQSNWIHILNSIKQYIYQYTDELPITEYNNQFFH